MTNFPIACQTITWGNEQSTFLPKVLDEVKAAGYAGVEIGFRHIRQFATPPSPPASGGHALGGAGGFPPDAGGLGGVAALKKMLDDRGLALAAVHIGGNLLDSDQADEERSNLDLAFEYMQAMGTEFLIYSGLRFKDEAQFAHDFMALSTAAERCHAIGKRLLYHNHNWEFECGGEVITALTAKGSHHLGFCPDIGWVMKGGRKVLPFLDEIKKRVYAIHFKDFATDGPGSDTVVLGTGIAPLREAAEWLHQNTGGMWVIAEQDTADIEPGEAASWNAQFLKSVL